jgi:hypothetical protein
MKLLPLTQSQPSSCPRSQPLLTGPGHLRIAILASFTEFAQAQALASILHGVHAIAYAFAIRMRDKRSAWLFQ